MDLPDSVRDTFRAYGKAGGRARAERLAPQRRSSIARVAAIARWTRERFGSDRFADLGLPGGALVDEGLRGLAVGEESVEALLVALAAPRLRREGVPVPEASWPDPEIRCYRLIEQAHGDLAHARYLALLQQMESFSNACHLVRRAGGRDA